MISMTPELEAETPADLAQLGRRNKHHNMGTGVR